MSKGDVGTLVGKTLGGYRLTALIGVGGMAEVYRGVDTRLGRTVAVKVLAPSKESEPDFVRRFRDEARRVAALNHANVVPVYHFDEQKGRLFLVMPLLDESLRQRMGRMGLLPISEAVRVTVQIAAALDAAHAQGIIHRDVKPENILLNAQGTALLSDFGIARQVQPNARELHPSQTLSDFGLPIGTPEFMAPEQLRMAAVDSRADIYALGAVLYELLTGHTPHEAATPIEVAALTLSAPVMPPSLRNPAVWPELDAIALRALAYEPLDRFPDARQFAAALTEAMAAHGDSMTLPPTTLVDRRTYDDGASPTYPGLHGAEGTGGQLVGHGAPIPALAVAPGAWPLARRESRRTRGIFVALLMVALLAVVGGGVLLISKGLPGSLMEAQVPFTATNTPLVSSTLGQHGTPRATSLPGSTATASAPTTPDARLTATPTSTSSGTPTATPTTVPTSTSTPVSPTLTVNPAVITLDHKVGGTCEASGGLPSQTVMNPGTQPLDVHYSGFSSAIKWDYNSNYSNAGTQPSFLGLVGGDSISFYIQVTCPSGNNSFTVTLTDSLGRSFPITVNTHR